jgi:hypothetical protein
VTSLRKFVNTSTGNRNGCSSDLVSALSAVTLRQQQLNIPSSRRTDLIFVTNGLIVDRSARILMTKNFATRKQYRRTLGVMLRAYPRPDLHGIVVRLVGTGWSQNITNDKTGPWVRQLWTTYLTKAGAKVHVVQHSTDLPGLLGLDQAK